MRVRAIDPRLQVFEHAPHADHADTAQWTGHAPSTQTCSSPRYGHALPPCAGLTSTVRARVFLPSPQVFEHRVNRPHFDMTQSTGHAPVAQSWVCLSAGQALPLWSDSVATVR